MQMYVECHSNQTAVWKIRASWCLLPLSNVRLLLRQYSLNSVTQWQVLHRGSITWLVRSCVGLAL